MMTVLQSTRCAVCALLRRERGRSLRSVANVAKRSRGLIGHGFHLLPSIDSSPSQKSEKHENCQVQKRRASFLIPYLALKDDPLFARFEKTPFAPRSAPHRRISFYYGLHGPSAIHSRALARYGARRRRGRGQSSAKYVLRCTMPHSPRPAPAA